MDNNQREPEKKDVKNEWVKAIARQNRLKLPRRKNPVNDHVGNLAKPEELIQGALDHYERVSNAACDWLSTIPQVLHEYLPLKARVIALERELGFAQDAALNSLQRSERAAAALAEKADESHGLREIIVIIEAEKADCCSKLAQVASWVEWAWQYIQVIHGPRWEEGRELAILAAVKKVGKEVGK